MTILPGFYQDSVFQYLLSFQLISVANSLKQQNRFDESEEIIERLIKTATGTVGVLAEQTLCELCRCELCLSQNQRIFTASELRSRAERMPKEELLSLSDIIKRIVTGKFSIRFALAISEYRVPSPLGRSNNHESHSTATDRGNIGGP